MKQEKILNTFLITSAMIFVGLFVWLLFCDKTNSRIKPTNNKITINSNKENKKEEGIIELAGIDKNGNNIYKSDKYNFEFTLNKKYTLSNFPRRETKNYVEFNDKNTESNNKDVFGIMVCEYDETFEDIYDKQSFIEWRRENKCLKDSAGFNEILKFNTSHEKDKFILTASMVTGVGNVKNTYWYLQNKNNNYLILIVTKDYSNFFEIKEIYQDIDNLLKNL